MAKNLMILGTASTVGKSILTAAFCRIFKQDGYDVAPFKSQNMALNSYVTADGLEMGRAQVVQAEAAGIAPMVQMNPILLKPTSDVGSQIIINGKVYKNMKAADYFEFKKGLKPQVMEAYNYLDECFDVIVLEGAGSPAEINLKQEDLVNMGMAEMVDAPVILVGDIDKGGVFASIYGTVMLLEPHEQARIKGYIINKFRGDVEILKPGIDMFYEKLQIPCLGVVPFMDHAIDDEDSVTTRFARKTEGALSIGVIRLPYMSNFTDFTVFDMEPDVALTYAAQEPLDGFDMIIIPGSKNTLKDMQYLHNSGISENLYRAHKKGTMIMGICGGYQMLGLTLSDPKGMESGTRMMNGLGLLQAHTVMREEKTTVQIKGCLQSGTLDGLKAETPVSGYEIHMGETVLEGRTKPAILLEDGRWDGAVDSRGTVMGTYLHGIFDSNEFRSQLLNGLRRKSGLETLETGDYNQFKEQEYDRLADLVRSHVDLEKIKAIVGIN